MYNDPIDVPFIRSLTKNITHLGSVLLVIQWIDTTSDSVEQYY